MKKNLRHANIKFNIYVHRIHSINTQSVDNKLDKDTQQKNSWTAQLLKPWVLTHLDMCIRQVDVPEHCSQTVLRPIRFSLHYWYLRFLFLRISTRYSSRIFHSRIFSAPLHICSMRAIHIGTESAIRHDAPAPLGRPHRWLQRQIHRHRISRLGPAPLEASSA